MDEGDALHRFAGQNGAGRTVAFLAVDARKIDHIVVLGRDGVFDRLLLTGTVITNKPIDVFSQYKFADSAVFGSSFYLFRNRYFDMVGYGNYTPVMKRSMEAEFTKKLHSIAFRATKAECLDLPECTDIVQRVELEPAARRVYLQLVKDSYELRVSVADGGAFDLSETEKEIIISVVLAK